MSTNPLNVSDWLRTPAPFNIKKHGRRARFSGDNSVVERQKHDVYDDGCVCYTSHPLAPGPVWDMTILNTIRRWYGGLIIGVTTTLPDIVPDYLHGPNAEPNEWYYLYQSLWHNGKETYFPDIPSLDELKTQQRVGIQITLHGDFNLFIDGCYRKTITNNLPVNQAIFGVVDVRNRCTKIKSDILSDPMEYLNAALKDGFIPHKDDLFLFHGAGGVGKSSLISMVVGEERDLDRNSTAVVESLHVCPVKDVTTKTFTPEWENVNSNRLLRMVAHTSHHLITSQKDNKVVEDQESAEDEIQQPTTTEAFLAKPQPAIDVPVTKSSKTSAFTKFVSFFHTGVTKFTKKSPKKTETSESSLTTTLKHDPDNIMGHFTTFQEDIKNLMHESKEMKDFILSHSIRILDSGGQPQFHELVSILLPGITGIISVFKLSQLLSLHGEVVWYKDGEAINVPYQSYFTNEQVIRHDLQAIQSQACSSSVEDMPNLAFVGTFLDEQHLCPDESPNEKDKRLHSMITEILPEDMQQSVITNGGSLHHVTFRVNARTPSSTDYQMVRRLKVALLNQSRAKSKDLPLKWAGLEAALCVLMERLDRQVLSRQECEFIGHNLGFDFPSLNAALKYLCELHIIALYDVLPNLVFASSQVVLDKITEVITFFLELKKGDRALVGEERKFLQQGIFSLAMLHKFSKHYRDGLFTPNDLLNVLISLLVVTEVRSGEFLVPCVLEVSTIYPSPALPSGIMRSSFVLHFSKKSPMIGIYCCTISYLMSEAGWKLLTDRGEVLQIARNSVTFELPMGFPGKLTFLDPLSSYFEVVIELPAIIVEEHGAMLYHKIRHTISTAIQQGMQAQHYKVMTPELSFLCPEQSDECSKMPHLATVDSTCSFLKCTIKPATIYSSLSEDQMMWLNSQETYSQNDFTSFERSKYSEAHSGAVQTMERSHKKLATAAPPISISDESPNLPDLLRLRIHEHVVKDYELFAISLLDDKRGGKLAIIKERCRGDPKKIIVDVLTDWLQGKGVAVSWQNLVAILRDCNILLLAKQIEMALEKFKNL